METLQLWLLIIFVAHLPQAFERLFEGSNGERHITAWFGRFASSGAGPAGAAVLAAYALAHRGQ